MASRHGVNLSGLLVPLVAIAGWQMLVSTKLLDYEYLPAPSEVVTALVVLVKSGELVADLAHTLGVALLAAAITLTLGGALGLAIGLLPTLRRYVIASIDFLRTIPAVALVPVAVLTLGPAVTTELILAVYAALWPIVLNTAGGVAAVHPRQYDVARMFHFSPATTVRKIVIPAAVPAWLVGARLAAVIGLLVAIVAEMIMYPRGLGGGLIESLNALAPARMWAYALVCGVVGFLLNAGLRRAVRLALPGSTASPGRDVAVTVAPTPSPSTAAPQGLLPIAALLIVWQLTATDDSLSFPPPDEWLEAVVRLHREGLLSPAIAQTLGTYVLGLAFATVIGAAVGVAIGASRRTRSRPDSVHRFRGRHPRCGTGPCRRPVARPDSDQWRGGGRADRLVADPAERRDGDALHPCGAAGDVAHRGTVTGTALARGRPAIARARNHARRARRVGDGPDHHAARRHPGRRSRNRTASGRKPAALRRGSGVGTAVHHRSLRIPDECLSRVGRTAGSDPSSA